VKREGPDLVAFEVSDTGPGFPPDVPADWVPSFFSTKPEGLGVGLSLCRSIAEAHGGKIEIGRGDGGGAMAASPCQRPKR
jgi:signal transduction histidine kinase